MTKKIAISGIFISMALVLSFFEGLIPMNFGIPGVKLGLANIVAFPVAGTNLLNGVQGLFKGFLEGLEGGVFPFFQQFHLAAKYHSEIDNDGIQKQDEKRQWPIDPKQYNGGTQDAEYRHNKFAGGDTDEIVHRIEIGHQVRGHCPAAQCFIGRHRDLFETV